LAAVLGTSGWDVLLVERRQFTHHKVCGEFLSPESQDSLQALGLYQTVKALSPSPITQARLVSHSGLITQTSLPGCAWGISRFALDAALAAAAEKRGAELRTGVTATAIRQVKTGFEVELRLKKSVATVQTRAVIAACGRYSLSNLPPRQVSPWRRKTHVGLKCHYENVRMPAQVELFFFPGGYAGLSPIEAGRVNLCLLITPEAFARSGKKINSVLQNVAHRRPELGARLAGGTALFETEVAVAPVDVNRPASPWEDVACLGDTAVMIPPLCGDGLAMALRSAELCAPLAHDFLEGRLSLAGWQAAYQAAWHIEFDRLIQMGRCLQAVLSLPLLSDAVIGLGHLVPALTTYLIQATRRVSS
jgi:flavin-dependent dehydrogenase